MKNKNSEKRNRRAYVNIDKKASYTLIAIAILSLGFLYVAAAPPGAAPNPGHLGSQLAPGSVATAQIADGAVTPTELADNAVTNTKIASDALSLGKVSAGLLTVLGSNLGIGTANPTEKLDVNGKVKGTQLCIGTDCRTAWPAGGGGGLGGSGTLNKIPKFTPDGMTVGNSLIFDDGTNVGIGTISPTAKLEVNGNVKVTSLASCDTIDTNAQGVLSCGTDAAGSGGLSGGITNSVTKWTSATAVGNSVITDTGTNVGIGTTSPSKKLDVNGDVNIGGNAKITGLVSCDTIDTDAQGNLACGTDNAGSGGTTIPTGAVMFFNLAACPTGWSALTTAAGRYIVGLPSGGTLAGTQGTVLSNLESRPAGQHTHPITDPGHTHTEKFDAYNAVGATGTREFSVSQTSGQTANSITNIQINNPVGSVAGTNAPYIQFLVCQKS